MYSDLNIAVIGDVMLDMWVEADEYKLSPEAAVLDLVNPDIVYIPGGAGNVAMLLSQLGVQTSLFTVMGRSQFHDNVVSLRGYLIQRLGAVDLYHESDNDRELTVKIRPVCHGQQLCRISLGDTTPISDDLAVKLTGSLSASDIDGILISDYSKGVMTPFMIELVLAIARDKHIPVLVDPKDNFKNYKGCTIFKPNLKELQQHKVKATRPDYMIAWDGLRRQVGAEYLVITLGDRGMYWTAEGDEGSVEAHKVEVANVSGCGDAAAAVMLLEYIKSGDIERAVTLANYAASRIVQRERTGYLDIKEIEEFSKTLGTEGSDAHLKRVALDENGIPLWVEKSYRDLHGDWRIE